MNAALLFLLFATAAAPVDEGPIAGAEAGEQVPSDSRLDILGGARDGQIQCFQPEIYSKTCKIMATYRFEDDGRIFSTAQMLMDENGPAVLVVTAPVEVKDGALCGQLDVLPTARFVVAGQPATPGQESGYRLMLSMAPRKGEVCARWIADGHGYVVHGSLDGKPQRDFDQRMIWVDPSEGFQVAP
ncbi:MAG: hypothetical protein K1X35_05420 [Caulobacteraceae bacterium]|nr:hypothetical protein [Caulobacteraceae bacterium]